MLPPKKGPSPNIVKPLSRKAKKGHRGFAVTERPSPHRRRMGERNDMLKWSDCVKIFSSLPLPPAVPEDDDGGWKRSCRGGCPEPKATTDKSDFAFNCIVMPPSGISPSWNKADNRRSLKRRLISFLHPFRDFATVRGIHPADASPVLCQTVVRRGKKPLTLGIAWKSANVNVESKLDAELIEERLGRRPYVGEAR